MIGRFVEFIIAGAEVVIGRRTEVVVNAPVNKEPDGTTDPDEAEDLGIVVTATALAEIEADTEVTENIVLETTAGTAEVEDESNGIDVELEVRANEAPDEDAISGLIDELAPKLEEEL